MHKNNFLVFGKELYNFSEIYQAIEKDKVFLISIKEIDCDYIRQGKYISMDELSNIQSFSINNRFFWYDNIFVKNPIIIKNGDVCNINKGVYDIFTVDKIKI